MTSTRLEFISPEDETKSEQLWEDSSRALAHCAFRFVILRVWFFLLTTRTLAACLCSRKAMLRCTSLLSFKEDESRVFLVVYSVCTCRRTFTTGARG